MEFSSLAEFELLRLVARDDIQRHPWTDQANRQITTYQLRMDRAWEELVRLNVEVARLNTWMDDEEADYEQHIQVLRETDPLLCGELQKRLDRCQRLNNVHWQKFVKLFALPGYTGSTQVGHRAGTSGITLRIPPRLLDSHDGLTAQDEQDADDDDNDDINEELFQLEEFIHNIPNNDS